MIGMTFFGLSESGAETSRDTNGLNELIYRPVFGKKLLHGFYSLSFRLMLIAFLAEVIVQLIGLICVPDYSADFKKALLLLGAAVLAGILETLLSYRSELVLNKHCANSAGGRYRVFRDSGKTEAVHKNMLAKGDVVFLSEGDEIPADGTVAGGTMTVECSAFGVLGKAEKTASENGRTAVRKLNDPHFAAGGSAVCSGCVAVKINEVGNKTLIAEKNEAKPVNIHEGNFAKTASAGFIAAAAAAGLSLICNAVLGIFGDSPSGLASGIARGVCSAAAAMSAACFCGKNLYCMAAAASAAKRLERKAAGISKPDVLNTAAETDIIFTDRAGMIAETEYTDSKTVFIDGSGNECGSFTGVNGKLSELLENAVLATSQAIMTGKGEALGGNALDRALLRFIGSDETAPDRIKKQAEVRPDGEDLISGAAVSIDGKTCTFIRGGAEIILGKCSDSFAENGIKQKITNKNALIKLAETISLTGKDVVALAVSDRPVKGGRLPTGGCVLIGLIALRNNILDCAENEIKRLKKVNVKTVLVTDKSREAAIYAVKHSGIKKSGGGVILNSEQLAQMSDKELSSRLKDIRAVVRALPADRLRLIRAAHDADMTVCASVSDAGTAKAVSDADWVIASPNCRTAARALADASSEQCGIKAAADIIFQSEKYFSECRLWTALKITVSALIAAALIFF